MIATLLEILVPIFYLIAATQFARYVAHTTRAEDDERLIHAILVAAAWPVTMPFYFALHESETRHLERELDRREEIEHWKRMTYKSLTRGRDDD